MQGWHKKGVFWFIFKKPKTENKVQQAYFKKDMLSVIDESGRDVLISDFGYKVVKLEAYGGVTAADGFYDGVLLGSADTAETAIEFFPAREYVETAFLLYVNTEEVEKDVS